MDEELSCRDEFAYKHSKTPVATTDGATPRAFAKNKNKMKKKGNVRLGIHCMRVLQSSRYRLNPTVKNVRTI